MLQQILSRDYYLLIMLVVGLALGALGRRWSNQERQQRRDKPTDKFP